MYGEETERLGCHQCLHYLGCKMRKDNRRLKLIKECSMKHVGDGGKMSDIIEGYLDDD